MRKPGLGNAPGVQRRLHRLRTLRPDDYDAGRPRTRVASTGAHVLAGTGGDRR